MFKTRHTFWYHDKLSLFSVSSLTCLLYIINVNIHTSFLLLVLASMSCSIFSLYVDAVRSVGSMADENKIEGDWKVYIRWFFI